MADQADLVDQLFNSSEKTLGENSVLMGIRKPGRTGGDDSEDHAGKRWRK